MTDVVGCIRPGVDIVLAIDADIWQGGSEILSTRLLPAQYSDSTNGQLQSWEEAGV